MYINDTRKRKLPYPANQLEVGKVYSSDSLLYILVNEEKDGYARKLLNLKNNRLHSFDSYSHMLFTEVNHELVIKD